MGEWAELRAELPRMCSPVCSWENLPSWSVRSGGESHPEAAQVTAAANNNPLVQLLLATLRRGTLDRPLPPHSGR